MLKGKGWLKDQILSPKIYSSQNDRGQGDGQEIQEQIEGKGNQGNGKIFPPFVPEEQRTVYG